MKKQKILVVAAHPDDETLGMGGTIKKHSKENEIAVLILANGVSVRFPGNKEKIIEQEECSKNALKKLGVKKVFFARFPDQELDIIPLKNIINKINEIIKIFKPNIIYTHFYGDVNLDHRRTYEAAMVVARPLKDSSIRQVFLFEVPSSTEWFYPYSFSPNVFEDISKTIKDKIEAFEEYKNEAKEMPHPRHPEGIRTLARLRGLQVGINYAEAFVLMRQIRKD